MGQWWSAEGLGALSVAVPGLDMLKELAINFIISTIVWFQVKQQGRNIGPPINKKIGLKIY